MRVWQPLRRRSGACVAPLLAGPLGLVVTLLLAAVILLAGAATLRLWPLRDTQGLDRSRGVYWPEPQLILKPDPQRCVRLAVNCSGQPPV
jgi:hypothetical protein